MADRADTVVPGVSIEASVTMDYRIDFKFSYSIFCTETSIVSYKGMRVSFNEHGDVPFLLSRREAGHARLPPEHGGGLSCSQPAPQWWYAPINMPCCLQQHGTGAPFLARRVMRHSYLKESIQPIKFSCKAMHTFQPLIKQITWKHSNLQLTSSLSPLLLLLISQQSP